MRAKALWSENRVSSREEVQMGLGSLAVPVMPVCRPWAPVAIRRGQWGQAGGRDMQRKWVMAPPSGSLGPMGRPGFTCIQGAGGSLRLAGVGWQAGQGPVTTPHRPVGLRRGLGCSRKARGKRVRTWVSWRQEAGRPGCWWGRGRMARPGGAGKHPGLGLSSAAGASPLF